MSEILQNLKWQNLGLTYSSNSWLSTKVKFKFLLFEGEKERTLVIKTGDYLDEIFTTIATSIGIVEEDLAACFSCLFILICAYSLLLILSKF